MSTNQKSLAESGALRQLKHNDGSEGFVWAYDKEVTDRYIAEVLKAQAPSAPVAPTWRLIDIEGAIRISMQDNHFAVQGDSQFVSVMAKSLMPYFEHAALSVKAEPAASADPVVELNVSMLRSRSAVGVAKYGVTMADNKLSLRMWLVHALEESLDHANYLQRAMQEIDAAAPTPPTTGEA